MSTVVDYHVPVPDQVALLRMTFSSPLPSDMIETAVDFFDAIADSLTWKDARHG
jgi:hypothetical protein